MVRTYFDKLTLRIGLIDSPSEQDDRYVEYIIEMPGSSSSETKALDGLEELASDVRQIAWANPIRPTDTYLLDTKLEDYSWGADGSSLELLLDIAVNIGSSAALLGIGKFIKSYWPKREARSYTDDELIEHARRIMARKYAIDYAALKPVGIERDMGPESRTTARFTSGDRSLDVTIIVVEGIPVIERTYRDLPTAPG